MDKIELRKVKDLVPHPFNVKYFLEPSADPSFPAIRESIAKDGIQEPLIIKNDGTILSGNLRFAGFLWALAEKFKDASNSREIIRESLIPVRVHEDFASESDEVLYLIRSNLDRRQFTPERKAAIWDLWRSEYESVLKRKPGRPPADAPRVESPKDVAAQLGITVKTADALVVVKNSPLISQAIRMKVFNNKIPATTVAKAVTFAEEEAAREQRKPVQADVLRYLENPPPKKLSDTIQETVSKPTPPKTAEKPAPKPAVVKKADPPPPPTQPEPEPSFEDVLVQVEEPRVDTPEVVAAPPDEPEVAEPESVLPDVDPTISEPDESEILFDAGLESPDPSDLELPDPIPVETSTPGVIDLHTEVPLSVLKIDPKTREAWKAHSDLFMPGPPKTFGTVPEETEPSEGSNVVKLQDAKDKIIAKYLMTQAGKAKLSEAIRIAYDRAIDTLVEQAVEQRIAIARSIIEALLGDVVLNEDITNNLVGLHSSLDIFLKDIGAIADVARTEQNPYLSGLPIKIEDQLNLCRSFVSGLDEVDNPAEIRDSLLDIIQEAKDSVNRLTQAKRSLELNGLFCTVCFKPQFKTIHGDTCENGHGGAPGITEDRMRQEEAKQQAKSDPLDLDQIEDIDFDKIDLGSEPPLTSKSDLNDDELDDLAASILSPTPPAPSKKDPVVDILVEFSDELGNLV